MESPIKRFVVLAVIVALANGCVVVPRPSDRYRFGEPANTIRLESGYRNPFSAELCFRIAGKGEPSPRYIGVSLPMPDGSMYINRPKGRRPSLLLRNEDVRVGSCLREGEVMKVVEATLDGVDTVPQGYDEALFVAYQRGELAGLGYVSSKPIFDNHYSYSVDLDEFFTPAPRQGIGASLEVTVGHTIQLIQVVLLLGLLVWLETINTSR